MRKDKDNFFLRASPGVSLLCILLSILSIWILSIPHLLIINAIFGWKSAVFNENFGTFAKVYTAVTVCTIQWVHYYEDYIRKLYKKVCSRRRYSLGERLTFRTIGIVISVVANYFITLAVYVIMNSLAYYVIGLHQTSERLEAVGWYVDSSFAMHVAFPTLVANTGVLMGKNNRMSPMVLHYFTLAMWFFGWPACLAFTQNSYGKNNFYGLILLSMIFITIYLGNLNPVVFQTKTYLSGGNWDRLHYNLCWIGIGAIILAIASILICTLGAYCIYGKEKTASELFVLGINYGLAFELDIWPSVVTVSRFLTSRIKDYKRSYPFAAYFFIVCALVLLFGGATIAFFAYFLEPIIINYAILGKRGTYNELLKETFKWSGPLGLFIGSFVLFANAMKDVYFINDETQEKLLVKNNTDLNSNISSTGPTQVVLSSHEHSIDDHDEPIFEAVIIPDISSQVEPIPSAPIQAPTSDSTGRLRVGSLCNNPDRIGEGRVRAGSIRCNNPYRVIGDGRARADSWCSPPVETPVSDGRLRAGSSAGNAVDRIVNEGRLRTGSKIEDAPSE